MSRGFIGLGRAAGDHLHQSCSATTSWLVLACLALTIGLVPTHALAEPAWQELWSDNFDHSINDGWDLEPFTAVDRVGVVPEGFEFEDRGAARCENNVLYGRSPNSGPGHGFAARTPSFREMGLHPQANAYSIEFRYKVLSSEFCWTVPLASPDLTLVISECSAGGQRAQLGMVSDRMTDFQGIAEIEVGVWHNFTIHVRRLMAPQSRIVSIMIDGEFVERIRVDAPPEHHRGITFLDLPALPFDTDALDDGPPTPGACFGSGYWDDVRFSAFQEPDAVPDRSGRIATLDPNPFNPATTLRMQLDVATQLDVAVFDLRGRRVRALHSGVHPAGRVELFWNGRDAHGREVSSGVYLVRVMTPDETRIVRGVLVR